MLFPTHFLMQPCRPFLYLSGSGGSKRPSLAHALRPHASFQRPPAALHGEEDAVSSCAQLRALLFGCRPCVLFLMAAPSEPTQSGIQGAWVTVVGGCELARSPVSQNGFVCPADEGPAKCPEQSWGWGEVGMEGGSGGGGAAESTRGGTWRGGC